MTPEAIIKDLIKELRNESSKEDSLLLDQVFDKLLGPMDYEEAARYCKCEVTTLQTMVSRGTIPFRRKIGVKFFRAELNPWMDESEYGRALRKAS